jgi:hypothetical protein
MGFPRLAPRWWILLTVIAVAAFIALVDLSDRRRSAGAISDGYVSQLFAGEGGWALLSHARLVTSWRVPGPAGHAVLPDRQTVAQLVALLHEGASYAHGATASVHAYDVAVRFEDDFGSMTLMFTRDGAALEVLRDGNPLSQADTTPVRERLRALFPLLLGEPAAKPGH